MASGTRRKAMLHPAPQAYWMATNTIPASPKPVRRYPAISKEAHVSDGCHRNPAATAAMPASERIFKDRDPAGERLASKGIVIVRRLPGRNECTRWQPDDPAEAPEPRKRACSS